MAIRITRRAIWDDLQKCVEPEGFGASLAVYWQAFYACKNEDSHILYGSTLLLLGGRMR